MLNRIILIGRLTRDPELRYTPAGVAVTQFTLAVDRPFSNSQTRERETDFINIVTWRQLAETCANYLRKGRLTAVESRLQVRNYDNNEGKKVYVLTEEGKRELAEKREAVQRIWRRSRRWEDWGGAFADAERVVKQAFRAMAGEGGAKPQIERVREILRRALRELEELGSSQ